MAWNLPEAKTGRIRLSNKPSSLSGGAFELQDVRDDSKRQLIDIFSKLPKPMTLMLDPQVIDLLQLVFTSGIGELKKHGAERLCDAEKSDTMGITSNNVTYLLRTTCENARLLCRHIVEYANAKNEKLISLILIPERDFIFDMILKQNDAYSALHCILPYPMTLLPIDDDLLSMEAPDVFRQMYVEGDAGPILQIAQSLHTLELLYGRSSKLYAKGDNAAVIFDVLQNIREESSKGMQSSNDQGADGSHREIDAMVILDRSVDYVTSLLTPLTFEGQIDEKFDIQHGAIVVDEHFVQPDLTKELSDRKEYDPPSHPTGTLVKMFLNTDDNVYEKLRDRHFSAIKPILNDHIAEIKEVHQLHAGRTTSAIPEVSKRLPEVMRIQTSVQQFLIFENFFHKHSDSILQWWELEHSIVDEEKVDKTVSKMIAKKEPLLNVLRLLALMSQCTSQGFRRKDADAWRTDFIRTYGMEHLQTWINMETCGLIKVLDACPFGKNAIADARVHEEAAEEERKGSTTFFDWSSSKTQGSWGECKKQFNLVDESGDWTDPIDFTYVTSRYAPLTVRMVESVTKDDKQRLRAIENMPGPVRKTGFDDSAPKEPRRRRYLICFVGGVTYAEISALRWLAHTGDVDFTIFCTHICNGEKTVRSVSSAPEEEKGSYLTHAERAAAEIRNQAFGSQS